MSAATATAPGPAPVPGVAAWLDAIAWDGQGLVPAIAQDATSGSVLMVAWMNREALARTREIGEAVFWSRSRSRLWHKGEESGQRLAVREIRLDCDGDVVLLQVVAAGPPPVVACHTGRRHCFFRRLDGLDAPAPMWTDTEPVLRDPSVTYGHAVAAEHTVTAAPAADASAPTPAAALLERLGDTIAGRVAAARRGEGAGSYVATLVGKGDDAVLKKVGEEAVELVMAAKDGDADHLVREAADLWFHSLVALALHGRGTADVLAELARREGRSGLAEFAARPHVGRAGDTRVAATDR